MSLFAPGLSARIKGFPNRKPLALLPFYLSPVSPEWAWFWDSSLEFLVPCWEGGGNARDIISEEVATRTQGADGAGRGEMDWLYDLPGRVRRHRGQTGTGQAVGVAEEFSNLTDIGNPGTGDFTAAVFFVPRGSNAQINAIFGKTIAGSNVGWLLLRNDFNTNDNSLRVHWRTVATSNNFESSAGVLVQNALSFVLLRRIGTDCRLFHNGIEVADTTSSLDITNDIPISLGQFGNNAFYGTQNLFWAGCWLKGFTNQQVMKISRDPFGPFHTRSLPLFLPSVADTFDTALLGPSSPRWDRKMRIY